NLRQGAERPPLTRWRMASTLGGSGAAPPVTIAWILWHLIWWWSALIALMRDETPAPREHVGWPGSAAATVELLESMSQHWSGILANLTEQDLERPFAYPWPEPRPCG